MFSNYNLSKVNLFNLPSHFGGFLKPGSHLLLSFKTVKNNDAINLVKILPQQLLSLKKPIMNFTLFYP